MARKERFSIRARVSIGVLSALAMAGEVAAQRGDDDAAPVERHYIAKDWAAYSQGTAADADRLCWVATRAFRSDPDGQREVLTDVLMLVTTEPQTSVTGIPSGIQIDLVLDGRGFPMFGRGGRAWLSEDEAERPVLDRLAGSATVRLQSAAVPVADFSSNGFAEAYEVAQELCAR
ncbi:MAG: hypothetical protein AAGG06_00375 [Pseudomonadota bacterium]